MTDVPEGGGKYPRCRGRGKSSSQCPDDFDLLAQHRQFDTNHMRTAMLENSAHTGK